ncbi:energy-coupled thiamine transporter ThiT [Pseudalkalibacillus caeni]|uniref:energy-coupled thiamine transporter ThiT n=1 Tax=Exobacillus caeni TaxID=2574798 RepID=UPI00267FA0B1
MSNRVQFLAEIAIMAGLAVILDLFSFRIWANGGSVSLAMIPIFFMAFRRGLAGGLITGLLVGILQVIIGPLFYVHPVQFLLDYPIAFTVVGFAGLFKVSEDAKPTKRYTSILLGCLIGSGLRFLSHYISGVVWFGSSAPEGTPVELFSLIYNGSYMLPIFIISSIILVLLSKAAPRLVHGR